MNKFTQQKFQAYIAGVAQDNGEDVAFVANGGQFTVTPTMQQKLENAVLESSDFLKRINVVPVTEMKGAALRLGVLSPVASRTDTNTKARCIQPLNMRNIKTNRDWAGIFGNKRDEYR